MAISDPRISDLIALNWLGSTQIVSPHWHALRDSSRPTHCSPVAPPQERRVEVHAAVGLRWILIPALRSIL